MTDVAGNAATCTQSVTITDDQAPVVTCPADITVDADPGACAALVNFAPATAADNCSVDTIENDFNGSADASGTYPVGTTTITWTATDIHGNTHTCQQNVTVVDNQLPTITCAANLTQTADAGQCGAMVDLEVPATTDNCGVASIENDYNNSGDADDTYPVGTTIITWTVTDVNGNTNTCTQEVTITDDEQPSIACGAAISQSADAGVCQALVDVDAPATDDNCAVASIGNDYTGTDDADGIYPVGTTVITWTVTDIHGNTNTCTQSVTVTDDEQPSITCPADLTQTADAGVCVAALDLDVPATADNCGVASIENDYNGTDDADDIYPVGTTVITWTVTDIHGNTNTCAQEVTVTDDELPTITCPADVNQTSDSGACEAAVVIAAPATADNCGVASVVNDYNGTADASDVYPVGTTTIIWTVFDLAGNTATCEQTVTITDDEAPAITCGAAITQTADTGVCQAAVAIAAPGMADNCGVASIVNDYNNTADASDVYPVGTTVITWTLTDIHGNTNTCTQEVTVTDDEQPQIACAGDMTQTADAGGCDAVVTIEVPVTADNCGVASIVNDYNGTASASDVYTIGTTTITWSVIDIHGNTSTCLQTVTITDDELPTITCPADVNQTADAGVCEAAVLIAPAVADDNCGVASVVNDYNGTADASDVYPVGTTMITWTVTDLAGNTATCEQTVVITDDEAPSITCPADISQTAETGVCQAAVLVTLPGVNDNCAVATVTNDYTGTSDASDVYPVGTTTISWTVTDIHGNSTTCAMEVTVNDDEAPQVVCPDAVTLGSDLGTCEAAITLDAPFHMDNCGVDTVINDYNGTSDASDTYPVGTTVVTWTVTDIHGNVTTCTQEVTVEDTEAPAIACPADAVVFVNDQCEFEVPDYTGSTTSSDNCDMDLTLTQTPAPGTVLSGSGTVQTITVTATDDAGNATSCSFDITLDDAIAPAITCPGTQTEFVNDACEFTMPDYTGMAGVTDNCDAFTVTQSPEAGTVFTLGTFEVTLTATDPDGNFTTCVFDMVVMDNTAPVVTCPADVVEPLGEACSFTLLDYTEQVVASDNCSDVTIVQTPAPGTEISANQTITMDVTDESGNLTTCTFEVILEDFIAPEITCPGDIEVESTVGECGAVVNYPLVEASDNCTVADVSLIEGLTSGSFFPVGTTVVTWEVTDSFGNTASCSFEVTVEDKEAPAIACPEDIAVDTDLGVCGAVVTYNLPAVSDNCEVAELTLTEGLASGETFPVGETEVSFEVIDIHGNESECTFVVTVTDAEAPTVVACPEDIVVNNDAGECGAEVTFEAPEVTDNCGVEDVELVDGLEGGEFFPLGTTTNTWMITDEAGNISFCTFTVTVEDAEAPVISCPEDVIVSNDPGICGAVVEFPAPEMTDNCGNPTMVQTGGLLSGDLFPVGATPISYEATDETGNVFICTFNVIVEDTEAPVIECGEDIVQEDPIVTYELPAYSDNCGAELQLVAGLESGDVFPHGITEVVYMAIDEAGNSVECGFSVLVNTPPTGNDDTADLLEEDDEIEIDVLNNDWDLDGDEIHICGAWAAEGEVEIEDGLLIYSVEDDWCGVDTVTYVVCDEYFASDTAQVLIQVECFIDLIIPEAFSPNGDGTNDTFEILGLEDFPGNELIVFNRWGHQVYKATDYQSDWGGQADVKLTLGNGLLPTGTYFYILKLGEERRPVKGYVYLKR
ncbi:MAG: HYR domain-containing protein [Flavobacteriales bacterium]